MQALLTNSFAKGFAGELDNKLGGGSLTGTQEHGADIVNYTEVTSFLTNAGEPRPILWNQES